MKTPTIVGNRSIVRLMAVILLISGIVALTSCRNQSLSTVSGVTEDETIAVVNNKRISLARFQARLSEFLEQYNSLIVNNEKNLAQLKEIVINQLIDEELLNQEAARKGIRVSDEEFQTELSKLLADDNKENLSGYLEQSHLGEEVWKNRLRQHLVHKKLVEQEVIDKIPITKREISSYYHAHRDDFVIPQAFLVRNITLATQEEAEAVRSMILRGTNFKYLVQEHSISPDKEQEGNLGYIERGDLPLEMESEIFSSSSRKKNRQISDVIRSQDGWHILKLEKYRRRKRLTLDEARTDIKEILLEQKKDESYQRWLDKLKQNATISINQAMLTREEGF